MVTLNSDGRYDPLYLRKTTPTSGSGPDRALPRGNEFGSLAARLRDARLARPGQGRLARLTAATSCARSRKQNLQVSAGQLGAEPIKGRRRLPDRDQRTGPAAFEPKSSATSCSRPARTARSWRLATWRTSNSRQRLYVRTNVDNSPTAVLGVFQAPGANSLATRDA